LLNLNRIEDILEEEKPSILESGDPYQVAWKAVASGRSLGIPAVGFYHSHFPEAYIRSVAKYFGKLSVQMAEEISQRYVAALYNRFEHTLVPSPALARLLQSWNVDNVELTDLGVDTHAFQPLQGDRAALRAAFGLPQDAILLLYVGRLATEKNVRTLFDAFELLHASSPGKFHLIALGDGTRRPDLQRIRENTGAVTWHPYCSDAFELAKYYQCADLFVHPGILETFGLVTLEAQACGTPVVGIRGSYMDRIIFTNQVLWANENTPEALAGAIQSLSACDLRAEGLKASQTVRENYGWDAVFSRLFSIYRRTIAEYNP
jgi:alpha-1,6-mannosyltransferase